MLPNKEGIVVLIFVSPFGMAEQALIDEITRLHEEEYKDMTYAVALEALFGWKNSFGEPVNRYVIEHNDLEAIADMQNKIEKVMYETQTKPDFPEGEALPEVIFAKATPIDD